MQQHSFSPSGMPLRQPHHTASHRRVHEASESHPRERCNPRGNAMRSWFHSSVQRQRNTTESQSLAMGMHQWCRVMECTPLRLGCPIREGAAMTDLTDAEIDNICDGYVQNAAKIRYLRSLGLRVERKPNGRPLVNRAHYDAIRGIALDKHFKITGAAQPTWGVH